MCDVAERGPGGLERIPNFRRLGEFKRSQAVYILAYVDTDVHGANLARSVRTDTLVHG